MPQKFKKLMYKAGIDKLDLNGKFVAIKIHFGEMGNLAFIRPNYAKAVADVVSELGGKPFLTDCNTLYPGSRKNAIEHLYTAWENGFSPLSVGCPVIIADGLKGTDEVKVPVVGGEYVKNAKIGHAIMDADVYISLSHFKDHENDAPILPDIGMFISRDMIALDEACADACLKQTPIQGSQLSDNMANKDFIDHHDHFRNSQPNSEWRSCLEHGEKIGLGSRDYELVIMK